MRFSPAKVGDFCDEIYINTEYHHFVLTVSAKVGVSISPDEPGQPESPTPVLSVGVGASMSTGENSLEPPTAASPTKLDLANIEAVELDENASLKEVQGRMNSAGGQDA